MIILGLIFFRGRDVTLWFPGTRPRIMPVLAEAPTTPASVRSSAVHRHVAEAKAVIAPVHLHLSAEFAGDLPCLDVGRLK